VKLSSKRRLALTGVSAITVAALAVGVALALRGRGTPTDAGTPSSPSPAGLGAVASKFTATQATARGTKFRLAAQRGHLVLLSFLDTQAQASVNDNPSRAQIVPDGPASESQRLGSTRPMVRFTPRNGGPLSKKDGPPRKPGQEHCGSPRGPCLWQLGPCHSRAAFCRRRMRPTDSLARCSMLALGGLRQDRKRPGACLWTK
jgi:hypothetical protein